ncbi:MAG: hypothetical protein WBA25_12580 [Jannaschia sp.]
MAIRDWMNRKRLRRLERRDDVVAYWSEEVQALFDLGEDLIPGPERELSRDLYGLLIYAWAAEAERAEMFDACGVLRRVRTQAWRGYTEMPALLDGLRRALPRGGTGARMVAFFGELAAKRATYLFLPVIAGIDRHQSAEGPVRIGALQVDGLTDRHADRAYGQVVRAMFAGGPELARDRDVFLLAIMVVVWDTGPWQGDGAALLALVETGLRRLRDDPAAALAAVRADIVPGGPHAALAAEIATAADEIASRAPWLWLDVLFLLENARAGPQWFEHAFEVRIIPAPDGP